jgi:hypothetical protein
LIYQILKEWLEENKYGVLRFSVIWDVIAIYPIIIVLSKVITILLNFKIDFYFMTMPVSVGATNCTRVCKLLYFT